MYEFAKIRTVASSVYVAVAMLFGASAFAAPEPASLRIISTDLGECLVAEMVVNDVFVGYAFEARDGYLSRLNVGTYSTVAQYYPPDLILIKKSADLTGPIHIQVTTSESPADAKTVALEYVAKKGKGISHDLSLGPEMDPRTCRRTVSAVQKISGSYKWAHAAFFEQLYAGVQPDQPTPTFSKAVNVSVERPVAIEFREGDHVFRRTATTW